MVVSSEFSVRSSTGGYRVRIGSGGFDDALTREDVFVVIDSTLLEMLPERESPVLAIIASEDAKTLTGCERLIESMREAGIRRGDDMLAVGGGVVQDMATFVAQIYMRGLAWSYVPTTLMSMADSCIGGKSSINVGDVKNLVGGIYPPNDVVVDPVFLASLSPTAIASGLAEAVKIAYCRGPESFEAYLKHYDRFDVEPVALIEHTLRAKWWFVEVDEHDQKERRLLNFGHTFGHALETAVDHRLSHGLAVAVGVLSAIQHPAAAAGPDVERLAAHCRYLLASAPGVADALAGFDPERFERAFRADKKHGLATFSLILPAARGGVVEVQTGNTAGDWGLVEAATLTTLDSLTRGTA